MERPPGRVLVVLFRMPRLRTHGSLLLRCVLEPSDHPITGPKLDRMIIEQRFGLFEGFAVILADDLLEVCEMFVVSYNISPVLCHLLLSIFAIAGRTQRVLIFHIIQSCS
jgi:hypothetical protein